MSREKKHSVTAAIIYCRVSSKKQEKNGDGLASQEARCREYASYKGYTVETVFNETLTGSSSVRPAMTELLTYLKARRKEGPRVVIIDSQSRFARDVIGHLHLRDALKKAGGILESPSQSFGDSSHDRLVETVLAAGAQFQREINAEQTRDRMSGRVINGYWPFQPPIGYRHEVVAGHKGKLLIRDEPLASVIQEALEGFASGRFQSQGEVKRFLESYEVIPRNADGEVRWQQVSDILTRVVYAGYIELPEWNI
jgi:DNA invertase Pin-like site-specific DNA recombinase